MNSLQHPAYPVTLYYDGSCRLCSGEIRNLMARNHASRLVFVDCSPEDFAGGPAPRAALMNAIHAVDAEGRVFVGIATFRIAYAAVGLPAVSALLGLPGVAQATARAYPVLVRNRHRLPGWLIEPFLDRAARRATARSAGCRANACQLPAAARGPAQSGTRH